jgi:hypothetical protein
MYSEMGMAYWLEKVGAKIASVTTKLTGVPSNSYRGEGGRYPFNPRSLCSQ